MGKKDQYSLNSSTGAGDVKIIDFNGLDKSSTKDKQDIDKNSTPSAEPKKNGEKIKNSDNEKKKGPQIEPVSYFSLFRFGKRNDKIIGFIGVLASVLGGLCTPAMVIVFGDITQALVETGTGGASSNSTSTTIQNGEDDLADDFLAKLGRLALYMALIGIITFVLIYIFVTSFNIVAENVVHRLRSNYLKALLRQDIGWYDTVEEKAFVSRMAEDVLKVGDAVGEKVGLCIFFMSVSLFSVANAFWHGWKLTLVVLSSAPVLAIVGGIVATIQSKLTQDEQGSYAKAGKVAEEVITNIRTVMAFNGEEKEMERYEEGLREAEAAGKRRGLISGFGVGLMWLIIYASYALAFWYGTKLILEEPQNYSASNLLIVFFSVLMGAFNIGQSASYFEAFATGRGAAAAIYQVIDRNPPIDVYSSSGKIPSARPSGKIEFKNIKFSYPSRPDVQILKDFSLKVEGGKTVALVGHSGCGKSTCLQLLQRFYDPSQGQVLLDGEDIKDLNLEWIRSQIGVVSQEPVLFNTSIYENIRYGRESANEKEIEEAARQANAHLFISKLPKGYHTLVGDRGAQLSGGQKQRVAIARAILRECPILLLDEATSALDTQSESVVQSALDRARQGRTTLIVAHRLSTIRTADYIVTINNGAVEEVGTHSELLALKGLYHQLVTMQMAGHEDDEELKNNNEIVSSTNSPSRKSIIEEDEVMPIIEESNEDDLDEDELAKEASTRRLMALNKNEWGYMVLGTVSAIVQGAILPFYAIIFGEFLGVLSEPEPEKGARLYALLFLVIGLIAGAAQFFQIFSFTLSGEALTLRIRKLTFGAIMRQEPAWFDSPSRSIGSLCARLSGDAASVNGMTGSRVGVLVQALSTLSFAFALSMYYIPKLGAVAVAFSPLVLLGTYFEGRMMTTANVGEKKALEGAAKVAVEAISGIRTVASLGKEKDFRRIYDEKLRTPHRKNKIRAHVRGGVFGLAQSIPFFAYSTVLWYGGYLIENEGEKYDDVFKVAEALIFGSMMIGQAISFAPNYNKAKVSAARILRLLDRRPAIDNSPGTGLKINESVGRVGFERVVFSYPTRPNSKILNGLSIGVDAGHNIALVGHSGCGKSSTINLLLRFYDPISGSIKLDDIEISSLNVHSLRAQMSIVSQEPALFDRTIRENISYGNNNKNVGMDEVIEAAKLANIHNFISSLPAGYETYVGEMGSQLSGGQKQRIAIARALVKSPRVLLLDEATSALDMESEKVVQEALDAASSGRTTITIAHRLSSIQNADRIFVINNGVVAESGTHAELLQHQGIYTKLWTMQGQNNTNST